MKWISVKEKLPLLNKSIIFIDDINEVYVGYMDKNNFYNDTHYIIGGVTHWMPLPKPPTT